VLHYLSRLTLSLISEALPGVFINLVASKGFSLVGLARSSKKGQGVIIRLDMLHLSFFLDITFWSYYQVWDYLSILCYFGGERFCNPHPISHGPTPLILAITIFTK